MSKPTGSAFGKPQRNFDVNAFVEKGSTALLAEAAEDSSPTSGATSAIERPEIRPPGPPAPQAPVAAPVPPAPPVPVQPDAARQPRRRRAIDPSDDRRGTASYKHKEINHEKLRRLAHRLDRQMGDMLDEALERLFPEWVAQVPRDPDF